MKRESGIVTRAKKERPPSLRMQTHFHLSVLKNVLANHPAMPVLEEAKHALEKLTGAIDRVDKRTEYLEDVKEPQEGTVLVYRDESEDWPIRCVIARVTPHTIVVCYPRMSTPELTFGRVSGRCLNSEGMRLEENERRVIDQTNEG